MNRDRAKKLLPIIQAFAEGKEIQFRLIDDDVNFREDWLDLPKDERLIVTFPADDYEYRIKPEPREFWVVLEEDEPVLVRRRCQSVWVEAGRQCIKVREVLE